MGRHGLLSTDGGNQQVNRCCPPHLVSKEVRAMMMENKKTAFETWLHNYGSHLEQLAGAKLSGPEQKEPSQDLRDPVRNEKNGAE